MNDAKFAAQVAIEILDRAEDGTSLFAVHRHYPQGWQAFKVGFWFALGCIGAAAVWMGLTKVMIWAGSLL